MICNKCTKHIPKLKSEKRPNARGFYYRDDKGCLWHGNVCPECYKSRIRSAERLIFKDVYVKSGKARLCRVCQEDLPAHKYFTHDHCCTVEVPYGEQEYGGYCQFGSGF